jgi:hypothetical protein
MHFNSSHHTPRPELATLTPGGPDDVIGNYVGLLMAMPWHSTIQQHLRRRSPMRFKTFIGRKLNDDQTKLFRFGPEHYRKAGVPYSPSGGMPVLEAYEVVNDLNRNQAEHQFVYYLAA